MTRNSFYNDLKNIERRRKPNFFISLFYFIIFCLFNFMIFKFATNIPNIEIKTHLNNDLKTVNLEIKRTSFLPFKNITVLFENTELKMEKVDSRTLLSKIEKNGNLEITISNINGISKTFFDYVYAIDDTPPIVNGEIVGKKIYVEFSDEDSAIDYDSIIGIDIEQNKILPLSIDKTKNSAIFDFNNLSLDVHIKDILGNEVVASFSNIEH